MKNNNTTLDTMIQKDIFDRNLNSLRKDAFDEALAEYDFGAEFIGNDSITKDDNIWSCMVYLFEDEVGETVPYSFTVEFNKDHYFIDYVSHGAI